LSEAAEGAEAEEEQEETVKGLEKQAREAPKAFEEEGTPVEVVGPKQSADNQSSPTPGPAPSGKDN
jgi:hypothetical protein